MRTSGLFSLWAWFCFGDALGRGFQEKPLGLLDVASMLGYVVWLF